MGNRLSVEQQLTLCGLFIEKDIKAAMFSIPNKKSLGPDGFCSGFFKVTWHLTKGLVSKAIQNFFHTGHMPSFLGETKLVALPKVPNPTQAKDSRPISCCNVLYKCVAKLICSRLKIVLSHLIHQNQGAFVVDGEIIFNILTCQDIVRGVLEK